MVEKGQLLDAAVTARVDVAEGERLEPVKAIRDDLAVRRRRVRDEVVDGLPALI